MKQKILLIIIACFILIILGSFSIWKVFFQNKDENIYSFEGKKIIKIWAREKVNLGPKPTLKDLLVVTDRLVKEKLNDQVDLIGLISINDRGSSPNDYYQINCKYKSHNRTWVDSQPVIYNVNYNYDISACADKKNEIDQSCLIVNASEILTQANQYNQNIIISEALDESAEVSFPLLAKIEPQDLKLDLPEVLNRTNPDANFNILFQSRQDGKSFWAVNSTKGRINLDDQ